MLGLVFLLKVLSKNITHKALKMVRYSFNLPIDMDASRLSFLR